MAWIVFRLRLRLRLRPRFRFADEFYGKAYAWGYLRTAFLRNNFTIAFGNIYGGMGCLRPGARVRIKG